MYHTERSSSNMNARMVIIISANVNAIYVTTLSSTQIHINIEVKYKTMRSASSTYDCRHSN